MLVGPRKALPGREDPIILGTIHEVLSTPLEPPYPDDFETITFGTGCFWGTEKVFWEIDGVFTTAAGYCGGYTPNPFYDEILTGKTSHVEVALVVYDPKIVTAAELLIAFFECHDPTGYMRQGRDIGTHFRSSIFYTTDEQQKYAVEIRDIYQRQLLSSGFGPIRTTVEPLEEFYFAEHFHQQYLHRNTNRTSGQVPTGVSLRYDFNK